MEANQVEFEMNWKRWKDHLVKIVLIFVFWIFWVFALDYPQSQLPSEGEIDKKNLSFNTVYDFRVRANSWNGGKHPKINFEFNAFDTNCRMSCENHGTLFTKRITEHGIPKMLAHFQPRIEFNRFCYTYYSISKKRIHHGIHSWSLGTRSSTNMILFNFYLKQKHDAWYWIHYRLL